MGAKWEFVASNPHGADAESKRTVRKAAMRAFRRNQREERMQKFKKKEAIAGSSPESDASSARTSAEIKLEKNLDSDRWDAPGQLVISPPKRFNAAPSLVSPRALLSGAAEEEYSEKYMEPCIVPPLSDGLDLAVGFAQPVGGGGHNDYQLFSHFTGEILPLLNPLGTKDSNPLTAEWAQHGLIDPVLFESILFHSSVHLDLVHQRPWSANTIYHRGEALRLLNDRLQSAEALTDDSIIAAVELLASTGNITGNVEDDRVHKEALAKMVELKGGADALGWDGALAMLLSSGDLISSGISSSPPMYESPLSSSPLSEASLLSDSSIPSPTSLSFFDALPTTPSPHPPSYQTTILACLDAMTALHATQTALTNNPTTTLPQMIAFHKQRGTTEHTLLTLRIPTTTPSAWMYEAARLAALICINSTFRSSSLPSPPPIITTLVARLLAIVSQMDKLQMLCRTAEFERQDIEVMFWAGFVAGIHAGSKQEKGLDRKSVV